MSVAKTSMQAETAAGWQDVSYVSCREWSSERTMATFSTHTTRKYAVGSGNGEQSEERKGFNCSRNEASDRCIVNLL